MNEHSLQLESLEPPEPHNASFFANSTNVAISGGTFTSHVHQLSRYEPPPHFRSIPLGDIELHSELVTTIRGHEIYQSAGRPKMYAARLRGREMTAAFYSGTTGAKEWAEEMKVARAVRHPNLLQLFGVFVEEGLDLRAAVYHGSVVSLLDLWREFRSTPLSRVELLHHWSTQFWDASKSIGEALGKPVSDVDFSVFFRQSNGRLCLQVNPTITSPHVPRYHPTYFSRLFSTTESGRSFAGADFWDMYQACLKSRPDSPGAWTWSHRWKPPTWGDVPFATWIAALYLESFCLVANTRVEPSSSHSIQKAHWTYLDPISERCFSSREVERLSTGWARYRSADVPDPFDSPNHRISLELACGWNTEILWASQATNLHHRLRADRRRRERYALVENIHVDVGFLPNAASESLNAYCFLAPASTVFQPDNLIASVAYWSMDPTGNERLSTADARRLGLPELSISAYIQGTKYPDAFYDEIDAFHRAKGFDPDSADVARHLGLPVFELTPSARPRTRCGSLFDADMEDGDAGLASLFAIEPESEECAEDKGYSRDETENAFTWSLKHCICIGHDAVAVAKPYLKFAVKGGWLYNVVANLLYYYDP
ncbi:hypothetical protein MKEN_00012400 [Mycena kentingensis (nom. inval.)]|nr:hypothetical protein MKEN_00012400 [Mycena kentingensis (nom. inval.)]